MNFLEAWVKQEQGKQVHNYAVAGCLLHVTKLHHISGDSMLDFMRDVPRPQRELGAWEDEHWQLTERKEAI